MKLSTDFSDLHRFKDPREEIFTTKTPRLQDSKKAKDAKAL
ncbi:MAG: hypothetical protein V1792_04810 [Pseudomonadota bacterium]